MSCPVCCLDRCSCSWLSRRCEMFDVLRKDDALTDVHFVVQDKTFRAHKVVLVAHSEYFHHLFLSGMRESSSASVPLFDVSSSAFEAVLHYVYTGKVVDANLATNKEILVAANMWFFTDLQDALLDKLARECTSTNCLSMLLMLRSCEWLTSHEAVEAIEAVFREAVRDRWIDIVANKHRVLSWDHDDLAVSFLDLDVNALKLVLETKSEQEEVTDFSFSFNQSDICIAVVKWIEHDAANRVMFLDELLEFFCLHQISAAATDALAALATTTKGVKAEDRTSVRVCLGQWCPNRLVSGLVVAHAWTPHPDNWITSDHVVFYFIRPTAFEAGGCPRVRSDTFYDVGVFGELGASEKHCLLPGGCLRLATPKGAHFMLSYDNGALNATLIDPVRNRYECASHHSQLYRFCPSSVSECTCQPANVSVCTDPVSGHVFVTTCASCQSTEAAYNPCCATFVPIPAPTPQQATTNGENNNKAHWFGRSLVWYLGQLVTLGGYVIQPGKEASLVHCSYDLQTANHNNSSVSGCGHSRVTRSLCSVREFPAANHACLGWDADSEAWNELDLAHTPFKVCDAAVAVTDDDRLYVIGGSVVEVAEHHPNVFEERPSNKVWVHDAKLGQWKQGPPLPSPSECRHFATSEWCVLEGFTRGSAYVVGQDIFFSGGAIAARSPQCKELEFFPNPFVLCLSTNVDSWRVVLDLSDRFPLMDYSVLAAFPTEVALKRLWPRGRQNLKGKTATNNRAHNKEL